RFSSLLSLLFLFNAPPTPEIYPLSLHDALPIWLVEVALTGGDARLIAGRIQSRDLVRARQWCEGQQPLPGANEIAALNPPGYQRSEEHTSELQSLTNLVCRLLLQKKKQITDNNP